MIASEVMYPHAAGTRPGHVLAHIWGAYEVPMAVFTPCSHMFTSCLFKHLWLFCAGNIPFSSGRVLAGGHGLARAKV